MKKKVKLSAGISAAMIAVSLLSPLSYADPFEDGTFIVGFDPEFPPYGYKDDSGEYVGFDLDLAEEVCRREGWTLVKQPIDWNSKDMELSTGAIDCIWNGFTIDGRENDYTWSVPYVDNSQVIVVRSDSGMTEASQLAGRIVAVQADSSALAALTGEDASEENKALAASFEDLQQVGDYNSAFLNLDTGAVDAVCLDVGVAAYEVKARNGFVILDEPISSEKYGVGFFKGNTKLRDAVQGTLFEMSADGTFDKIADKWELSSSVCLDRADIEKYENISTETTHRDLSERLVYMITAIAKGLLTSLAIFVLPLLFALPLGLLVAAGRMSKLKIVSSLIKLYISVVRGTPLMLQLLVVFFGPYYLFGIRTSSGFRFTAVIIGFTLNYAAYFAEIYRSGIQAVPRGQYEASEILGYSRMQRFFKIVFPQMVKNILPSVTNEVITLVKDTSLAFAVSCTEMFTLAKQVAAAEATILPLFIAGIFYYIFNAAVAFAMSKTEKKLDFFR